MALPFAFTGNTSPTGEQLDADLAALGALTPIPCSVAGTNAIALTPLANVPNVAAYANYGQFSGIAAATNTGAVTAAVGALAAVNVYKDTIAGPVLLTGGEIVIGTKLLLMYDAALNAGSGGFHLIGQSTPVVRSHNTTASIALGAITPQQGSTATVTLAGTSVGDVVLIGFPSSPSIGLDFKGFVPNAGTVVIQVFNMFAAATVTPNAGNYTIATQGYAP